MGQVCLGKLHVELATTRLLANTFELFFGLLYFFKEQFFLTLSLDAFKFDVVVVFAKLS